MAYLSRLLLLGLLYSGVVRADAPKALWVSPDGRDGARGTKSQPLATIEGARNLLRALRQTEDLPKGGITVWVRQGNYSLDRSLEFSEADGGSAAAPIVYRSVPGEVVTLSGGRPVRFSALTDPAILDRLGPVARTAVRVADLRAQGITDSGHLTSRGFGRPVSAAHLELFYQGRPMTLARWPNEGQWLNLGAVPPESAQDDGHGGKLGDLAAGFGLNLDRARRWQPSTNLWVHGYWAWDWANSYERVAELDLANRRVRTAAPYGLYGFRPGQRFYFLNVLEELDTPGEYYVDTATDRLYFWSPIGLAEGSSVVSVLDSPLIRVEAAAHLRFEGLNLEAGRSHGIEIRGGHHVRVVGCRLRNLGNHGIRITGGHDHEVLSSDIFDTGDGGVIMEGGDRATLTPGLHLVENCHLARQGRWSKCYVPAIGLQGVGLLARHNLIHDHPHCAVLFSGNDHRIEFNEIHHVALETGDVGAIYTGRDWTYRGNRIVHNYLHETGGVGMGSMGVYMDDCVSGTEIFGNVFYRVQRAVFLGGGRDHQVRNNLFIECHPAIALDGRGLDTSPVWHNMVHQTMKERLAAVPGELYRSRYPAIDPLDDFYRTDQGVPPEGNAILNNVALGGEWLEIGWHARPEMITLKDNFVGPAPGRINPADREFGLEADSPAWEQGFKPIPFERIGLYENASRRELDPTAVR